MGQMIGASPQELRDLSAKMRGEADRLDQIRNDLTARFGRTHWDGGDGDEIRADWTFRWSGQLGGASAAMQAAANALVRNAEQQELASGTDSASRPALMSLLYGVGGALVAFEKFVEGPKGYLDKALLAKDGADVFNDTKLGKKLLIDEKAFLHGDSTVAKSLRDVLGNDNHAVKDVKTLWAGASKLSDKPFVKIVLGDDASKLKSGANVLDKLGHVAKAAGALAFVGVGLDAISFADKPSRLGAVNIAFDAAEIATVGCPPLSFGLAVTQTLLDNDKVRGVLIDAAKTAGSGVAHLAVADVTLGEDAAHAAAGIASNGVHAVGKFLHW
jgi:hypothetical protein